MIECTNCGAEVSKGGIQKGEKNFCGPDCLKKYEEEHKNEESHDENVCEFC